MSNKDKPGFNPRPTEVIARETILGLFSEILSLTNSHHPRSWELVGMKLDEMAAVARIAEKALDLRLECATPAMHCPAIPAQPGSDLVKILLASMLQHRQNGGVR